MTLAIDNPGRCPALVVVFLLAGARGELTLAQDLAPDPYFSPMRPLKIGTGTETPAFLPSFRALCWEPVPFFNGLLAMAATPRIT
jgi:hypothetical protein